MAERIVIVCDVCGNSPAGTVGIASGDKNFRKDLCTEHLAALLKGARAPRRGRPARARTSAPSAPRRRGRPAKDAAVEKTSVPATPAKRARKKTTDPVILEKRRAALAKARQARADKRAAAATAGS